jgi:hypothetical protein
MHKTSDPHNTQPAPQNASLEIVEHTKSFHQSAAMQAARMITFQYTRKAKGEFQRECMDHLKASLAGGAA